MTNEEIIQGNKSIAEFMGMHYNKYNQWCRMEDLTIVDGEEYATEWHRVLKYNTSWDWLMPVVEKIEALNVDGNNPSIEIGSGCLIKIGGWIDMYGELRDEKLFITSYKNSPTATKIEAVWLAVVEFIKWYNNQNK